MIPTGRREPSNLVDHCRDLAESKGDDLAYTWLRDGEVEESSLSFGQLDLRAREIAADLDARGLRGERALLMYSPGLEFIPAFLGCLYAGVVAVPMNPPRNERAASLSLGIARHAAPAIRLTDSALAEAAWTQLEPFAALETLITDRIAPEEGAHWLPAETAPDALAFLQYTSGSTGSPKGVEVTHANVMRDEEMIRLGFGHDSSTVFTSWLPMFHDMGLIGNVLQPLYLGIPSYLMAPSAFVQKPIRWLRAMSRYRATTTGGPNFGYELCVQRVRPEEIAELDLSNWKVAYNGSEPVRASTLERFAETFAPAGFRRTSLYPCYGMAEATLFVTGGISGEAPTLLRVETQALLEGRARAIDDKATETEGHTLVSCGRPWLDQELRIVDPRTHSPLAENEIGEIWIAGGNVARGYRALRESEENPFAARLSDGSGPYLCTGDLGFLRAGELFVTGRIKDVIIQHGQNYYPQDIERIAGESHAALRVDQTAAFTVEDDPEGGAGERLVIVQEVHRDSSRLLQQETPEVANLKGELCAAVRGAVSGHFGIQAWRVVLIRHGSLPRTSSGKVQRTKCRRLWEQDELREFASQAPQRSPD